MMPVSDEMRRICGDPPDLLCGDVVQVLGSDVKMVVLGIAPSPSTHTWDVECLWMDTNQHKQEDLFPVIVLKKV